MCMPFTSTRPADALGRYLDDLSLWFVRETLTDGRSQGSNWFSTTFFPTASRATPLGGGPAGWAVLPTHPKPGSNFPTCPTEVLSALSGA